MAIAAGALLWTSAPYGRHARGGWGPTLPGRIGWILMESLAVLLFGWIAQGAHRGETVPLLLLGLWMLHYVTHVHLSFRLRSTRQMAAIVALMAFGFQTAAAFMNAAWLSDLGHYPDSGSSTPVSWRGVVHWRLAANLHADTVLLNLRQPGETGYRIPRGGLFRWVTAGNYLGLVMRLGPATRSWAGLAFFVPAGEPGPRAAQNHRWPRALRGDSTERRRLLPFMW